MQIILIDDGSEDKTVETAEKLGLTVLRQAHGGAAKARNRGLREAGGEYIFLLDCDDVPTENALPSMLAAMEKNPAAGAVFGKAMDFISPELTDEEKNALRPREEAYGGVLPGCALLRREVFDRVGLFEETLSSGETVAWMMALRDKQIPVVQIEAVTLRRRLHSSNTGRLQKADERANYAAILRARMKQKMAEKRKVES